MYAGMLLAVGGAIAFLAVGLSNHDASLGRTAGMVGWGCGAATTIFAAANDAIRKLKRRIAELETKAK
jgi:hypothetical protein